MPTSAHISCLVASRCQLDLLQHTMLLIVHTDTETACLLVYCRRARSRLRLHPGRADTLTGWIT
ncbi:hypothetical protein F5888DRAFT_1685793 [Russula emetica]|nr:hypothetical protein F5888DRAFT_1685793 [Russula emetica]